MDCEKEKQLLEDIRYCDSVLQRDNIGSSDISQISIMRRANLENLISSKHKYAINYNSAQDLWYTRLPASPGSKDCKILARTKEKLYEKLYAFYYGNQTKTLDQLFRPAIDWHREKRNVVQLTYDHYMYVYKRFLKDSQLMKMKATEVKASDLEFFFSSFAGTVTTKNIGAMKTVLDIIFDYAFQHDIITTNVCKSFNTRYVKTRTANDDSDNVFTDEDREKILIHTENSNDPYDQAIALAFNLCIRPGELRALHCQDINWEKQTILIHSQIVKRTGKDGQKHWKEVNYTKTGDSGVRELPLSERALSILERAVGDRTEGYVFRGFGRYGHTAYTDQPITDRTIRARLKAVCDACGVKYHTPHKSCFWAASAMAASGADIETMKALGGWASKQMPLHYIRKSATDERTKELSDKIFK